MALKQIEVTIKPAAAVAGRGLFGGRHGGRREGEQDH